MNCGLRLFKYRLWLKELISIKTIPPILTSFGSLWLFLEIATFFSSSTQIQDKLRSLWYLFLFLGIFIAIYQCKPKLSYGCKLSNRDVYIELIVGDLFKCEGDLIIGSNTTFDTKISHELISETSIQGQFTKIYYNGDETKLDKEIAHELQKIEYEQLSGNRIGKHDRYPIGTVVKLNTMNRINKTAYMIAIAHINEHGVASGTFEELMQALPCLWLFISQRGLKGNLVMPIIGSGYTRLTQSREEILREIIKSFVAACSESTFCDRLTIVITPSDIEKNEINMDELEKYLYHICKYTQFASNIQQTGVPV